MNMEKWYLSGQCQRQLLIRLPLVVIIISTCQIRAGELKAGFNVVPEEDVNESAYNDDSAKWFYAENDGRFSQI